MLQGLPQNKKQETNTVNIYTTFIDSLSKIKQSWIKNNVISLHNKANVQFTYRNMLFLAGTHST